MKDNVTLTFASLASILLMATHLTDDIVRGFEPGKLPTLIGVVFLASWLYGTLALSGRPSGYVIMLLASALSSAIPAVHMTGSGLAGGSLAKSDGVFFWVWTLLALGVTAIFTAMLSARLLWANRRGRRLSLTPQ